MVVFQSIMLSTPEGESILKQSRRITHFLVMGLICLLFFSACAQNNSNTNGSSSSLPAGSIVKVGVSLSLTGDDSADGQAVQQGYDTWEQYVNSHGGLLGHQVKMMYYDDGTKVDQVRANFEKLISVDHVSFVIGPFDDPQSISAAEVARKHSMFLINITGTGPEVFTHGFNNLFTVSFSATSYFTSFVHYILSLPADRRPKTAAYATSNSAFTEPQIDTARAALEKGGVTTVLNTVYPVENTDPTGPAQKVVDSKADIVLLGTQGVADCATFVKTFAQQHYNPKVVAAATCPDQGQAWTSVVGKNTEGVLVPNAGWWPQAKNYQNSEFVSLFDSKYKTTPDAIGSDSVQAFSAGQVLTQAVNQAQSLDNVKIMTVLRAGTFQSLQGPVAFDTTGQNKLIVAYLFQWQQGQLIPVFPQEQAMANLEYPKPNWATS